MCALEHMCGAELQKSHAVVAGVGRKLVAEQSSWACLGSRTGSLEHLSPLWPLDSSIYSEGYIPGSNLAVISLASIFQNLLRISLARKEKELVPKAPRG